MGSASFPMEERCNGTSGRSAFLTNYDASKEKDSITMYGYPSRAECMKKPAPALPPMFVKMALNKCIWSAEHSSAMMLSHCDSKYPTPNRQHNNTLAYRQRK
jgi:hypothetical protein